MKLPGLKKEISGQRHSSGAGGIDGREGQKRLPGELVEMYASHNSVEKGKVITVTYGLSGRPKILDYDLKRLVTIGGVMTCLTRGTILRVDDGVLRHMSGLTLLFISVAIIMWASLEDLKDVDTKSLENLADYMNGFCPFVLGLYVSLALTRWWALRVQALGSVFDAVANVSLIVSCVLPNPEHAEVRDLVVKWGMASIFLLVKAARDDLNLADLVDKGILSAGEVEKLQGISPDGQAMVMWAWIMRLSQETFEAARGPRPHAPKLMMVFNQCIAARNGIQTIHTYLKTQLPFAYVHLLTLLVNVNNLVVSVKCGAVFIVAMATNDVQTMGYQFMMLLLVPVLYHGLLSISYVIQDPFGEDVLDFPIAAFVEYVAQCCDAAIVAQDVYPGTPNYASEQDGLVGQATPPAQKKDLEVGELDAEAVGQSAAMTAAVDSIREFTGAVSTELSIIGTQLQKLHQAIAVSEDRRKGDAERLCVALMRQVNPASGSMALGLADAASARQQSSLPKAAARETFGDAEGTSWKDKLARDKDLRKREKAMEWISLAGPTAPKGLSKD